MIYGFWSGIFSEAILSALFIVATSVFMRKTIGARRVRQSALRMVPQPAELTPDQEIERVLGIVDPNDYEAVKALREEHARINEREKEAGIVPTVWDDPPLPKRDPVGLINYQNADVVPACSYCRGKGCNHCTQAKTNGVGYTERLPITSPGVSAVSSAGWEASRTAGTQTWRTRDPVKPVAMTRSPRSASLSELQARVPSITSAAWYYDTDEKATVFTSVEFKNPNRAEADDVRKIMRIEFPYPMTEDEVEEYVTDYLRVISEPRLVLPEGDMTPEVRRHWQAEFLDAFTNGTSGKRPPTILPSTPAKSYRRRD
jgi:hypothetical protein